MEAKQENPTQKKRCVTGESLLLAAEPALAPLGGALWKFSPAWSDRSSASPCGAEAQWLSLLQIKQSSNQPKVVTLMSFCHFALSVNKTKEEM